MIHVIYNIYDIYDTLLLERRGEKAQPPPSGIGLLARVPGSGPAAFGPCVRVSRSAGAEGWGNRKHLKIRSNRRRRI